ncbi:MAG TPA: cobaltochelatase subunit CobN [Chitinispirillaceae bacterium]|nr:cobaltochelatase subunit CobN [Chitinispirillaceae bacterium]
MKIGSIMWHSHLPLVSKTASQLDFAEVTLFATRELEDDPLRCDKALLLLAAQDLILLYRSNESIWDRIEERLKEIGKKVPIVCLGHDPSLWTLSTVRPEIIMTAHSYMVNNGQENFTNMFRYLCREIGRIDIDVPQPVEVAWEGGYHPDYPGYFSSVDEYLEWYKPLPGKPVVGILFTRHAWVTGDIAVENAVIREFEKQGMSVLPVFSYSTRNGERNCRGSAAVVADYFIDTNGSPRIDALIRLQSFLLSGSREPGNRDSSKELEGVEILRKLDVPVFCPLTTTSETVKEWRESMQGFTGRLVGWAIAMPELEGVIEPLMISAGEDDITQQGTIRRKVPIDDRVQKLIRRVINWVRLRSKPVSERKIAFILHNNPCASVEASVGGAAKLDSLESVASILKTMKDTGYSVEPPADGKELITTIMDRKAISDFRWTTVEEIVRKGGALKLIGKKEYCEWFYTLAADVQKRMITAWGNPPGEEINGVPAAMVHEGRIVVTGVQFGNAVVCVQPKRGCAGARCDGQVCKILHEPGIVPPHQYMAVYKYLEQDFEVDAIVHVGTHGNLEFLPGKGVGLSSDCFPDLAIGDMPHLYIYNSDNPPEGVIAKRRSAATLVDHMQTVMSSSGLYDELEELDRTLAEYEQVKGEDRTRDHLLQHQIIDTIRRADLDHEIRIPIEGSDGKITSICLDKIDRERIHDLPFEDISRAAHGALTRVRNSFIQDGMHIFGQLPQGDRRVDFIHSIIRYDADRSVSLRRTMAAMMGLNYTILLNDPADVNEYYCTANGELAERIDHYSRLFISAVLQGREDYITISEEILATDLRQQVPSDTLALCAARILDIDCRISGSREIEALLHGFDGGYIPPGPSGLIMRGRDDILPTGRNFYTLDPQKVPSKSAWETGRRLAEAVVKKHLTEHGTPPENTAIYWMANDIMWADGEGMAQIMYLLGVKPVWQSNGRVSGFEVIPLEQLGRERIDVTVRISGIIRDNFSNCVDIIDEAIQAVASLPESVEKNFVRKHALAQVAQCNGNENDTVAWRDATLRLFASKPGSYSAGTQLAVYASAWKEEKDLAEIFVYWNGYAYGKGLFGEEKHQQLAENLRTVDITYNKVVSDESDLFGCCSYFGTQGGMTAAARHLSGKAVKTYYGDTREPDAVEVRDMADEIRRVVRTKLLNPKWIEGQKRHGYKGAGDIMKRVGRVYGWEATTQEVDDWIFDDITETFVLDEENREFFKENNPWALEEISRRLLEAQQRGLWNADPEVLERLKESYLETESLLEENMGDVSGDFQGGNVDILTSEDVPNWGAKMDEIRKKIH